MSIYICSVCRHVEYGKAPEFCPLCQASKDKFKRNDSVFEEAEAKSKEGAHKHVPAVTLKRECGLIPEASCLDVLVRIGKTLHPMEEKHFIQWIDCYADDVFAARIMLTPHSNPGVVFHLKNQAAKVRVVEFCNLHGHWQAEAS